MRTIAPTIFVIIAACGTRTATTTSDSSACLGDVSHSSLAGYSQDFVRHVADSEYVIRAHVTAVGATTLPNTTATPNVVIANVDAVAYHGAEIDSLLGNWGAGATVTIDLASANLAVGDAAYFFVCEHRRLASDLADLELTAVELFDDTAIAQMHAMLDANPLYAAVATSVAVVEADVNALGAIDQACGSEHCPLWQPASFDGETALCGDPVVGASFASSNDIAWRGAPKLAVGQSGVFLVHRPDDDTAIATAFGTPPTLTLARAIDVHPSTDAAAIDALLAAPPTF